MPGWAREVTTTIADYMKGSEDALLGKRILLAALKKEGLIARNCGGSANSGDAGDFTWQVPYRQAALIVDDAETAFTPTRIDRWKRAGLNYVGYRMSDQMTRREKLRNKGPEQIIDVFSQMAPRLRDDAFQQLSKELYVDSSATGNSGRLSGIETMMAISGTMDLTATTAASRSANDADAVGNPSDTYAGLSTVLGNYGGSWTVGTAGLAYQWPAGRGDMQFDFYSPIICHFLTTNADMGGTGDTFATQGVQVSRYLITHQSRYETDRNSQKVLMFDRDLYRQYLNQLDSKERINVENTGLRQLGFKDTFVQDGVDVTWEIDMPNATGYLWDIKNMQLRVCTEDLFEVQGPWYEKIQNCYPVLLYFYGQMKFHSPRFFGKIADIV